MATRKSAKPKGGEMATQEATDPREFRKTNEAIGLRVREGKLSLLTRKVFNVMMYHAQEMKTPGLNAPIDTAAAKKYFWIPLSELARDAHYDSKDTEFLKQQLEELQNVKLLMENERQWTSERLVASITLVNPQGLKKHSGQVWFGFAFPPEVHELVMAPGTYTRFSIFYQGLLRSGSALALYEICRRYATNPSKLTLVETYEHWYGVLTGNPVSRDEPPPYKYFKRDTLKPAIAEINALTDIQVELVEHKNGRRIERLQFRVDLAKQPQLEFPAPPVIDLMLLGQIMELGFTQAEAGELAARHGDDKIRASIAFVRARMDSKGAPALDSPAAYFRWTLKQGEAAAQSLQLQNAGKAAASKKAGTPTVMQKFNDARAREALAVYMELDDKEREPIFDRFKAQNTSRVLRLDRGIENPAAKAMFSQWYAKELWSDPSVQDLATFVEQYGLAAEYGLGMS
jgi:hypothetical protein